MQAANGTGMKRRDSTSKNAALRRVRKFIPKRPRANLQPKIDNELELALKRALRSRAQRRTLCAAFSHGL